MTDREAEGEARPGDDADVTVVQDRIDELQRRKRNTVRWHMSRETAERAIAAITAEPRRPAAGRGKSRRRKRHKRLL